MIKQAAQNENRCNYSKLVYGLNVIIFMSSKRIPAKTVAIGRMYRLFYVITPL